MKNFKSLKIWEKSHQLALAVYGVTSVFPKDEQYGLTSQIRRAVVSIPANIAEGCGRATDADFARFLQIAMGSACELEYHLLLAHDLTFLEADRYNQLSSDLIELKRMMTTLIQKLKAEG